MKIILETERCYLREMNPGDAEGIFKLNQHPDILKSTTDPPFESLHHAAEFLKAYNAYQRTGMGRWAVILKASGEFIGWSGLKLLMDENEVDVGYRLIPEFWGKGYATETAAACCRFGLEEIGLKRLVARVHKENYRSVKVVKKLGMTYENDLIYGGLSWLNYSISKN